MKRRDFIKGLGLLTSSVLLPTKLDAGTVENISNISFSTESYQQNNAQTIMVYLYGGPSELSGNLSNFEEIQINSKNKYNAKTTTLTENNFWEEAGGNAMERMLATGDMKLFRTCYRKDHPSKSHGICTAEIQRGIYHDDASYPPGMFSVLGEALAQQKLIDDSTVMPFLTMEGNSGFFNTGDLYLDFTLRAAAIGEKLDNPYKRKEIYESFTNKEWHDDPRPNTTALSIAYDELSASVNNHEKIQEAFDKSKLLSSFIDYIREQPDPEGIEYPDNSFAVRLKSSIKVLINNPETKVISIGSKGLGGWDDHSDSIANYTERMTNLMSGIEAAMSHIKAEGRDNITIMVFGEFGRNVSLNDSLGWDHGNNQNVYVFGGQRYFNSTGIIGETELEASNNNNRLYLAPTTDSYTFEPYSIAATLYKMYGISNPAALTGGYSAIGAGLFRAS